MHEELHKGAPCAPPACPTSNPDLYVYVQVAAGRAVSEERLALGCEEVNAEWLLLGCEEGIEESSERSANAESRL